jgi:hypothetical protein
MRRGALGSSLGACCACVLKDICGSKHTHRNKQSRALDRCGVEGERRQLP